VISQQMRMKSQRWIEVSGGIKMNNNFSKISREKKINMLLEYAKECYEKGLKPTKKTIRKKFHLEVYNYFKNIADYHQKAGIPIAIRHYPRDEARAIIGEYVSGKSGKNKYPGFREIEKTFRIKFFTYFKSIDELYELSDVDISQVKKARNLSRFYSGEVINQQKDTIKELIRLTVKNGFYPGIVYIQKKLKLSFYNLYNNIYEAYRAAGVPYDRPSPIILGKKKELLLTEIVKALFLKMNFNIERVSLESVDFNKRADLTVSDQFGHSYLVELKAYKSGYHLSRREFSQLSTYLKKEGVKFGIFITTSATARCNFPNIWFINGDFLKKLLKQYGLSNYLPSVEWIQQSRVNTKQRQRYLRWRKQQIKDYTVALGYIPSKRQLEKALKLDIRSVFGENRPYAVLLKEFKSLRPFSPTS
jgi:hypothetical protein